MMNFYAPLYILAILTMLGFYNAALACSCASQSLQQYYDSAQDIVVARKGLCATELNQQGFCRDQYWHFTVSEVLKGKSRTNRTFSGYGPCALYYRKQQNFLLFVPKDGSPNICNGSVSLDKPAGEGGIPFKHHWIDIIRDYRDGNIKDLSGPWIFSDNNFSCNISHSFYGGSLSFGYAYAKDPQWSESDVLRVTGPNPRLKLPLLQLTFDAPQNIEKGSALIKVGSNQWQLTHQTLAIIFKDHIEPIAFESEVMVGAPVLEFLKTISKPTVIEISATREFNPDLPPQRIKPGNISIEYITRTTQLANAAERFLSCIESTSNN